MKIVLDECVDHDLRLLLVGHQTFTVTFLGWSGTKNGQLLRKCGDNGFDALITTDKRMPSQQNLRALPVWLVLLNAAGNQLEMLEPLVPQILEALASLSPKSFVTVSPR